MLLFFVVFQRLFKFSEVLQQPAFIVQYDCTNMSQTFLIKELLVLKKCKTLKYLQNICTKVSVTYLQHIGIWPHNISVTTDDRTGTGGQVCHFLLHFLDASSYSIYVWSLLDSNLPYVHILVCP
jgi:hypothetical protein